MDKTKGRGSVAAEPRGQVRGTETSSIVVLGSICGNTDSPADRRIQSIQPPLFSHRIGRIRIRRGRG